MKAERVKKEGAVFLNCVSVRGRESKKGGGFLTV